MITKTSAEAQNNFGKLLDTVQREPVAITRHGRTAAFIVSPRDMEELMSVKGRHAEMAADWDAWRKLARESTTPDVARLTDEEINRLVHELR